MSAVDLATDATIDLNDIIEDTERADYPPTVPFEEIERELLADPATRAAYDSLEPAYQIASLRIRAGLTQAELAELVGTKQSSIARLERGRQQPTIEFLRRLGRALGYRLELNFVPVEQE